ncbi:MAG: acetyl-CoA C-acetyltransferase [Promethearchaeota archaeon]
MVELNDVYIVDYVRTPFSRSRPRQPERDAYSELRADQLCGLTLRALFAPEKDEPGYHRSQVAEKVKMSEVDEFLLGCSLQVHDNFLYGGRLAWFMGGGPPEVPCSGYDRQCGSGMTGLHHGVMQIMTGMADVIVTSGMEHMTRVSMDPQINNHFNPPVPELAIAPTETTPNPWYRGDIDIMTGFSMIQTAQKLFEEESDWCTKQMMDEWGLRAHKQAQAAYDAGFTQGELVPVDAHKEGAVDKPETIKKDLAIRGNTSLEQIARLPPVSQPGYRGGYKNPRFKSREYNEKFGTRKGLITAGNSSPLNAGAATLVLMSERAMKDRGLEPIAKILSIGWGAVDPSVMGRGPVPASEMALKHAGLKVEDVDYWEINEAFCIVALNCIHALGIPEPEQRVNFPGGSTAIGHPLGATGNRLVGTVARTLRWKKKKYGLANLCCGGGQGVAVVVENPDA